MYGISPLTTDIVTIEDTYPITPAEVGDWLNLPAAMVTAKSDLINRLIKTATQIVENYAWIQLRRTTFRANYSLDNGLFSLFCRGDLKLTLERSPILTAADIKDIEYLDTDGTYKTFDKGVMTIGGLYENVTEKIEQRQWASVYMRESVPYDPRINTYKIRITFDAGFTDGDPTPAVTDVPEALKQALLMIVAHYFTNRGDCAGDCTMGGMAVPCDAKGIVDQYAISRTVLGGSYNPAGGGWY